jgi:hypothetical protein
MILVVLACPLASAQYIVTGNYAGSGGAGYPVSIQGIKNYTFTADPDEAISVIQYSLPLNTRVDFTLTYGLGSTVTGYMEYLEGTPPPIWELAFDNSTSTVSLGGMTRTENFPDAQILSGYVKHIQFSSYGINDSASPPETGFTLYAQGYGIWSDEIVFFPVNNIENNMISRFTFVSTKPIDISIESSKKDILSTTLKKSALQSVADAAGKIGSDAQAFIQLAISISSVLIETLITLLYYLKFFFVDNLGLTVGIYLSLSMAYAAATSKNIFMFFKKFINDQRKLFEFIISLWRVLVEIVATFRGIFRI